MANKDRLKELSEEQKKLEKLDTILKKYRKEWMLLIKDKEKGKKIDEERLKYFEKEYKNVKKLENKIDDVADKYNNVANKIKTAAKKVEEFNEFINDSIDGTEELDNALVSIGNTTGKNSKLYKETKNIQSEINDVLGSIFSVTKSIGNKNDKLKESAIASAKGYYEIQTSIVQAKTDLDNNVISQEDYNNTIQQGYSKFDELTNAIDYSGVGSKKLKNILESLKIPLQEANKEANLSSLMETVGNTDELYQKLMLIQNTFGESSQIAVNFGTHLVGVEAAAESIAGELAMWPKLTGKAGKEQNVLKSQITSMVDSYKDMNSSIADINKKYASGSISSETRAEMIREENEAFLSVIDSIDLSAIKSKELKAQIIAMRAETEHENKAMIKLQSTIEQVDGIFEQFEGIPAMRELNTLIKTNTKDTLAFKAAMFALGAAIGKAAFDYFGAPIKAAMQQHKETEQNRIETEANIAKIAQEGQFIPQKIEQERLEKRIEAENQVNELSHEAQYAAEKAAKSFAASMQMGAAQFQAAAKTALFGQGIGSVSYGAAQMQLAGVGADKVASAMSAAAGATGKMPTSKIASDMAVLSERTGQSVESIADINEMFQRMDGASEKTALNLQEGLRTMAQQNSLDLGKLMSEVAEASKDALGYQIKSGKALAKQVGFAQSMGVNFGDIAKAGKSMVMNYKDSIKAEMQLSSLLGEQVDLSEVRAKFAEGDQEGALKALQAQGLNPEDMDMFQQEALSQALGGLDLTSLSKIAKGKGKEVGALQTGNAQKGNQQFLTTTQQAQGTLEAQQAQISAKQAIVDAELSQKIADAYLASPQYKKYLEEQNKVSQEAEKLSGAMNKAWIESDAYAKKLVETQKLEFLDGLKEGLIGALAPIIGGVLMTSLTGGFKGVFGKITGMFGKGAGTADVVAGATESVAGGTGGVTDSLKGAAVDVVAGKADELVPGSGALIEGASENLDKSEEVIEKTKSVGEKFKSFSKNAKTIIKEITGIFKTFIKSIGDVLKEIINVIKNVGNDLISSVTSILQNVLKSVSTLGKQLADTLGTVLGAIVDNVGKVLTKGVDIVTKIGNKLATGAMDIFNTVVNGLTKASKQLPTLLGNLGKAVGSFFSGLGTGLLQFAEMMATPTPLFGLPAGLIVVGMAMGLAQALSIAGPGIKELTPLLIGLADVVGGTFVAAIREAGPTITAAFDGISKVIDTIGNTIATVINTITTSISGLAGLNAVQMLAVAGGISAMAGAVAIFGGASAVGGFMSAVGKFFGGDPVDKFRKFQELDAERMHAVADSINYLGNSIKLFAIPDSVANSAVSIGKAFDEFSSYIDDGEIDIINNFSSNISILSDELSAVGALAPMVDMTAQSFLNLADSLKALSSIDSKAINDIPWVKMGIFSKAGGKVVLTQNANKNFNITQDASENLKKMATNTEAMVKLNNTIAKLIKEGFFGGESVSNFYLDGKMVTKSYNRYKDNTKASGTGG